MVTKLIKAFFKEDKLCWGRGIGQNYIRKKAGILVMVQRFQLPEISARCHLHQIKKLLNSSGLCVLKRPLKSMGTNTTQLTCWENLSTSRHRKKFK